MKGSQRAPRINANDDEEQLVFWYVEEGSQVSEGQDLADFETSKAVHTVKSEMSGYVLHLKEKGERVLVGSEFVAFFATYEEFSKAHAARTASAKPASGFSSQNARSTEPRFTKAARALLELHELSVDLFKDQSLVTEDLVRERLQTSLRGRGESPNSSLRSEKIALSKQAEIAALSSQPGVLKSSLTVSFHSKGMRSWMSEQGFAAEQLLPLLVFCTAKHAAQNAAVTAFYEEGNLYFYDRVDIGIALDLGKGLKVVVIRNADKLSLRQVHSSLEDLTYRYLDNRLSVEELQDSTLTITDLSGFNVLQFEPLLNGKQSLILGIGGDDSLPGHPMTLTAAFDHRVLTGREVAYFLDGIKKELADHSSAAPVKLDAAVKGASESARAICCEMCGINVRDYYERYARDAMMRVHISPDGRESYICHVCEFGT